MEMRTTLDPVVPLPQEGDVVGEDLVPGHEPGEDGFGTSGLVVVRLILSLPLFPPPPLASSPSASAAVGPPVVAPAHGLGREQHVAVVAVVGVTPQRDLSEVTLAAAVVHVNVPFIP